MCKTIDQNVKTTVLASTVLRVSSCSKRPKLASPTNDGVPRMFHLSKLIATAASVGAAMKTRKNSNAGEMNR
jgi:hypothetical protein